MIIGVPREIKADEYRVGLLPVGAELLGRLGCRVLVESGAGQGSGYEDEAYRRAGASLVESGAEIWGEADLIVKVKEPQPGELDLIRPGQVVFTFFHFAADRDLTERFVASGGMALAYETLTDAAGRLPLLTPMSEIAGRMAAQEGAKYLERPMMGRGILLGGVAGVEPGEVLVLGGGVVGSNAAIVAAGLGARVVIMDVDIERLRRLEDVMPANVSTVYSHEHAIAEHAARADLVIGAVLIPGARTPVLLTRSMLKSMKPGAVVIDVGVDQGGCVETSRPTTHADPTFIVEGVVHYGVTNMPGAVGRTSTQALCHATQPYVLRLAEQGLEALLASDETFRTALNIREGRIVRPEVAAAHGL